MQDRYTGDVGDFGKYGLLRALAGSKTALRLGVVWYLFPNERHNADGKHVGYLKDTPNNHKRFRACDPDLYDALRSLVSADKRSVASVQAGGILPADTVFYEPSLSFPREERRDDRKVRRDSWLNGALEATAESEVIFVDPDNSISETVDQLDEKGPKYVYMEDLLKFHKRGQSLVIYHHLARWGKADIQIRYWADRLKDRLGLPELPWSLRYRRGSSRAYFIVLQERHEAALGCRLKKFLDSPWAKHGHFRWVC